jgi:diguanylate cyclase (GGDEF)-like protein/PAS domain S-box-containing protein
MKPSASHGPRRRVAVIVTATLLFAIVLGVRFTVDDPHEAVALLFLLPIALVAAELGAAAGTAAAAAATASLVIWRFAVAAPLSDLGMLERGLAFFLVGGLVGRIAGANRLLQAQNARQWDLSLDLLCTSDFSGRFRRVNPACERALGYPAAMLTSRPFLDFVHPEDRERTEAESRRLVEEGSSSIDFQNRYLASDGSARWLEWRAVVVREEGLVYAMARDITDRKQLEAELLASARHDPLTGLLNRRGFMEVLEAHVDTARRYGAPSSLLAIDLDGFKSVNDRHGHAAGDEILMQLAECIRRRLRVADVAGRLGGDEILVLLPQTTGEAARWVAARLVKALAEALERLEVTASIGVAPLDDELVDLDAWIAAADHAMYAAKRAGGNCHSLAPPARAEA